MIVSPPDGFVSVGSFDDSLQMDVAKAVGSPFEPTKFPLWLDHTSRALILACSDRFTAGLWWDRVILAAHCEIVGTGLFAWRPGAVPIKVATQMPTLASDAKPVFFRADTSQIFVLDPIDIDMNHGDYAKDQLEAFRQALAPFVGMYALNQAGAVEAFFAGGQGGGQALSLEKRGIELFRTLSDDKLKPMGPVRGQEWLAKPGLHVDKSTAKRAVQKSKRNAASRVQLTDHPILTTLTI